MMASVPLTEYLCDGNSEKEKNAHACDVVDDEGDDDVCGRLQPPMLR